MPKPSIEQALFAQTIVLESLLGYIADQSSLCGFHDAGVLSHLRRMQESCADAQEMMQIELESDENS
jgi:hypothetical protein